MTPQKNTIFCGGNLEVVSSWPPNCIDAICTDPPYGLEFMGKDWDNLKGWRDVENMGKRTGDFGGYSKRKTPRFDTQVSQGSNIQQWHYQWAKAMLRITKPGGFLLCFGGTRTYHRLACAIEDAGWEIRDCMMWLYGSGFPKSYNISKAIDKAKGKQKIIGEIPDRWTGKGNCLNFSTDRPQDKCKITAPATNLAQLWDGYGTALKPAWEPIIVAMKPLDGTFAHNAEAHGVAGLNIDGGRIGTNPGYKYNADKNRTTFHEQQGERIKQTANKKGQQFIESKQGRWPANLILDEEAAAMLDEQTGITTSKKADRGKGIDGDTFRNPKDELHGIRGHNDSGGASRFFYCAKTSRRERNMGLDDQSGKKVNDGRETPIDNPYQRGETIRKNTHPTVKPLALMRYLCTLLKMPSAGQIILDPFLGSGTTGIACKELGINFIGIEKEAEYCEIAVKRIAAIEGQEITLHTKTPSPQQIPLPVIKNESFVSESRQRIINAAVAALKEKRK